MTRRRTSRRLLETRAPRKGTLIIAAVLYIVGLFGVLGFFDWVAYSAAVTMLAIAGGLLILGALLRDL